ncbi:MAG: acylhydrolase, partial [Butyrivibrio sp.]|nr:acylhydrolase [Butyrivibrio sp.]
MERRRILCFGDSLTWGYDPVKQNRIDEDSRWTGVLQNLLGDGYRVIEEGQNGRTIATDDPAEGEKNGLRYVIPCIESHKPLDLMIVMLGTNDLKKKFSYTVMDIAGEMQIFLEKVLAYNR